MKVDLLEIENRPLISYDALGKIKGCAVTPSELNVMIEVLRAANELIKKWNGPVGNLRVHFEEIADKKPALDEALSKIDFGEGENVQEKA